MGVDGGQVGPGAGAGVGLGIVGVGIDVAIVVVDDLAGEVALVVVGQSVFTIVEQAAARVTVVTGRRGQLAVGVVAVVGHDVGVLVGRPTRHPAAMLRTRVRPGLPSEQLLDWVV